MRQNVREKGVTFDSLGGLLPLATAEVRDCGPTLAK